MQLDARLTGDAATLAQAHREVLGRLPASVQAFIFVELQKWSALFPPEQRYQRALLEHLSRLSPTELAHAAGGIARVESEAGIHKLGRRDPARLQDDAQGLLRKHRLVPAWRKEIDGFFQTIDPALEAELYPPDGPRRLVVPLYGSGIAVQTDNLWSRFKGSGIRIPLKVGGAQGTGTFLRSLFGQPVDGGIGPALFSPRMETAAPAPLDVWIIESQQALHDLCTGVGRASDTLQPGPPGTHRVPRELTGLSYDRLQTYRDELTRALYNKILSGVESPQAFAAYARSLEIRPGADALFHSSDVLQTFIRDVFLTGNGTLFVNNTFVEWAAVQALRRAQPRILVTRFGVRDRLKPFSSLLLFSQPRASDQIPMIEDPVGSFVDVEQLSYYVWLNAEKSPAYRNKALYLFLAEGIDEILAIRSDVPLAPAPGAPASTLSDVFATMAHWLGMPVPPGAGQPIGPLIA